MQARGFGSHNSHAAVGVCSDGGEAINRLPFFTEVTVHITINLGKVDLRGGT